MSVTITVHDPLATQLKSKAQQHRMTVDELAADLLSHALEHANDVTWPAANQRRLALMQKSATKELHPEEAGELQRLQMLADRRLEAMDVARLAEVERMEKEVEAALLRTAQS